MSTAQTTQDPPMTQDPPTAEHNVKPAPPQADRKTGKLPPYNVILHNDDHNDMQYVVLTILALTPLKEFQAIRRMAEAHKHGQTRLLTTHKEHAELYQDQFKSKGLTVTIKPA